MADHRNPLRRSVMMVDWKRVGPLVAIALGMAALGVAVAADLLGAGGQGGFGRKQLYLAAGGVSLVVVGLVLVSPFGQRLLRGLSLSATHDRPISVLLLASWFGLANGVLKSGYLLYERVVLEEMLFRSDRFVWSMPVLYLASYLLVGLLLLGLSKRISALGSQRTLVWIFAFLAFLDLLYLFTQLEVYARVVLAAGLATVLARLIMAHQRIWNALVRYSMGWVFGLTRLSRPAQDPGRPRELLPSRRHFLASTGAVVAALTLGVEGRRAITEGLAFASLPRPNAGVPNVLLIVWDTVRARSLGLHGYRRETSPYLERLATTGITFDRALATAPWTLPSHGSMFTGLFPHEFSYGWDEPFRTDHRTLAEVLAEHGYATAGFVANLEYCAGQNGHSLGRGFAHYEDFLLLSEMVNAPALINPALDSSLVQHALSPDHELVRKDAETVTNNFLSWQSGLGRRPFFAFLNYFDAHDPYEPPREFAQKFGATQRFLLEYGEADRVAPEDIPLYQAAYDGGIAYMDAQLGRMLTELERRGVLDNTLVIVTSDHGEHFGERGLLLHANSLYLPLLHVPLVLSLPRRLPSNQRVREPVSLRDIPATVMDLISSDRPAEFPGTPLTRFWRDGFAPTGPGAVPILAETEQAVPGSFPEWYPAMKGPMKSLTLGSLHYIKNFGDGQEELYDFVADPAEERNLVGTEVARPALDRLRASMEVVVSEGRLTA